MGRYNSTNLLTPPREEEEVFPYRRIWRSLVLEMTILFGITVGVFILTDLLGIPIHPRFHNPLNDLLAILPAILWLVFSRWPEQFVPEPRKRLTTVFIISALVANWVNGSILAYFQIEKWLPLLATIDRLIGYTVTVGIIHEISKYLVIRYAVWENNLRVRLDAVAYSAASATGYITMLNIQLLSESSVSPSAFALRVFANTVIHLAASVLVSYGIAETRFNTRAVLVMPFTLGLGAFLHGLSITVRSGVVNAGFTLGIAGTRPVFGFMATMLILVIVLLSIFFLFSTREHRDSIASRGA